MCKWWTMLMWCSQSSVGLSLRSSYLTILVGESARGGISIQNLHWSESTNTAKILNYKWKSWSNIDWSVSLPPPGSSQQIFGLFKSQFVYLTTPLQNHLEKAEAPSNSHQPPFPPPSPLLAPPAEPPHLKLITVTFTIHRKGYWSNPVLCRMFEWNIIPKQMKRLSSLNNQSWMLNRLCNYE